MEYIIGKIDPVQIADLREAVGWNRMDERLSAADRQNFLEIGCYEQGRLIGYLCVVSNRTTDAYIQDVMVHPDEQGQGIGSRLMTMAIERIGELGVSMISVIYGDARLMGFYEKFGFTTMMCGQMEIG